MSERDQGINANTTERNSVAELIVEMYRFIRPNRRGIKPPKGFVLQKEIRENHPNATFIDTKSIYSDGGPEVVIYPADIN